MSSRHIMPLEEYLEYYDTGRTVDSYWQCFHRYLEIVTGKKISRDRAVVSAAWTEYLESDADPAYDLSRFPVLCRTAKDTGGPLAPYTVALYLRPVQRYLSDAAEIEMSQPQKRMQKRAMPKGRGITVEVELTKSIIRTFLSHGGPRLRMVVLMEISGGLRIGEVASLKLSDIDLDAEPAQITIRPECSKNKIGRVTFISPEAADACREYLKVREHETFSSRQRKPLPMQRYREGYLTPVSIGSLERELWRALEDAGLGSKDERSGMRQIHHHLFRKFFITQAKLSGASAAVVEDLAGHEGYLDRSYRRLSMEERRAEYAKALPRLMVYTPDDYEILKTEYARKVMELEAANAHSMALISDLMRKIDDLERRGQSPLPADNSLEIFRS